MIYRIHHLAKSKESSAQPLITKNSDEKKNKSKIKKYTE
jgi:hypothetical protein